MAPGLRYERVAASGKGAVLAGAVDNVPVDEAAVAQIGQGHGKTPPVPVWMDPRDEEGVAVPGTDVVYDRHCGIVGAPQVCVGVRSKPSLGGAVVASCQLVLLMQDIGRQVKQAPSLAYLFCRLGHVARNLQIDQPGFAVAGPVDIVNPYGYLWGYATPAKVTDIIPRAKCFDGEAARIPSIPVHPQQDGELVREPICGLKEDDRSSGLEQGDRVLL